jgi:hypothetical protein
VAEGIARPASETGVAPPVNNHPAPAAENRVNFVRPITPIVPPAAETPAGWGAPAQTAPVAPAATTAPPANPWGAPKPQPAPVASSPWTTPKPAPTPTPAPVQKPGWTQPKR